MESVVLCRNGLRQDGPLEAAPATASPSSPSAPGCLPSTAPAPAPGGYGTSTELVWELIDIFDGGLFPFPVYDHDSARDVVRYLLERGILEEEIADAVKDSAVDMNTWLERGDKYMVGEWVIAWINACREDYIKQKAELGGGGMGGGRVAGYAPLRRNRSAPIDGSTGSLGRQCGPMNDDEDGDGDGDCIGWGGGLGDSDARIEDSEELCIYRAEACSTSDSFRGAPSFSSGLSKSSSNGDDIGWTPSSPPPPTPFHRLAPFLRRPDHPGGTSSGGLRRRTMWWRAVNTASLQHLTQSADEKSDSGIVTDMFDRTSRDDVINNNNDDYDVTDDVEIKTRNQDDCVSSSSSCSSSSSHKASLCSVASVSRGRGSRCSCKLPHYARFEAPLSSSSTAERCVNCGRAKDDEALLGWIDPGPDDPTAAVQTMTTHRGGQYYKDFVVRALEYTLETTVGLVDGGPGHLFVLVDPEDGPVTWTGDKRYRVAASARRPELCVAAYRSRGVEVDLLWSTWVDRHGKVAADVQTGLERHRLHSNWFRCALTTVMETVHAVMARYQATGCLDNEP